MIQDDYIDAAEPDFGDQCIEPDFGTDALIGDPEPIPFSGEEYRYYATISRSNFALYMSRYVAKCRLSKRAKTGLNHVLASFFDDNVVLSNNTDNLFDLAMIELETALTDHDTKSREWIVLTAMLRAQFKTIVSRSTCVGMEEINARASAWLESGVVPGSDTTPASLGCSHEKPCHNPCIGTRGKIYDTR